MVPTYLWYVIGTKEVLLKRINIKPHSQPNGFYWGHQCSWTLTPASSMQVSIMQSDNRNKEVSRHMFCYIPEAEKDRMNELNIMQQKHWRIQ